MGQVITLTARDGHSLSAYEAKPSGTARGGLVVVQEIFGVNNHIRGVCDGYAADGYHVVAPALFDRVGKGIELGYSEVDIAKGRDIRGKVTWDQALADVAAALAQVNGSGKVGIVGYCWGGTVTWVSCTKLDGFSAGSSYYGGGIGNFAADKPKCPVICHFGEKDHAIPLDEVQKVKDAGHPGVEVHIYPSGHGFNCDERGSYDAASAKLARERTLAFFRKHIG
jgi:carboxymethylenebutenolidase